MKRLSPGVRFLLGFITFLLCIVLFVTTVAGILVLAVYTSLTKKEWKIPALEILMRACYGIALVIGIVIMNVHGIAALAIVHKASAALFVILLAVLFVLKLRTKKS